MYGIFLLPPFILVNGLFSKKGNHWTTSSYPVPSFLEVFFCNVLDYIVRLFSLLQGHRSSPASGLLICHLLCIFSGAVSEVLPVISVPEQLNREVSYCFIFYISTHVPQGHAPQRLCINSKSWRRSHYLVLQPWVNHEALWATVFLSIKRTSRRGCWFFNHIMSPEVLRSHPRMEFGAEKIDKRKLAYFSVLIFYKQKSYFVFYTIESLILKILKPLD